MAEFGELQGAITIPQDEDYSALGGLVFPVMVQRNLTQAELFPTHYLYGFPSEPFKLKAEFLGSQVAEVPRTVLTVLGANWPLLYLDLWGEQIRSIHAVDPNRNQIGLLNDFLTKPLTDFGRKAKKGIGLPSRGQLPYMGRGKEAVAKAEALKAILWDMIREERFQATNGLIQDLPAETFRGIQFVDLSNVPEIDQRFSMPSLVKKLEGGTLVYYACITGTGKSVDVTGLHELATRECHDPAVDRDKQIIFRLFRRE